MIWLLAVGVVVYVALGVLLVRWIGSWETEVPPERDWTKSDAMSAVAVFIWPAFAFYLVLFSLCVYLAWMFGALGRLMRPLLRSKR